MARLDIYVNYERQASIKLEGVEVRVGRDPNCVVQIADPRVSRCHAVISQENGNHVIENFSANGTKVNGRNLDSRQTLIAGDAIFISSYILVYQPDDAPVEGLEETVLAHSHR